MTDTDKLKRLAEAAMTASPAPWLYRSKEHDDWGTLRASDGWPLLQISLSRHTQTELGEHRGAKTDPAQAEAEYIEAANPQAILALIAENERLTGCLREANKDTEHFERHWYIACHERDEAVALLRRLDGYDFAGSPIQDEILGFLASMDTVASQPAAVWTLGNEGQQQEGG